MTAQFCCPYPGKRMRLFMALLILSLAGWVTAGAPDRTILLKSQKIKPSPMAPSLLSATTAKSAQSQHYLIQFSEIPTPAERKTLAASGIKLLAYVPNYAYWASIAPSAPLMSLASSGQIIWAQPASTIDTLSPSLRSDNFPPSAMMDDGNLHVRCVAFADVERSVVERDITNANGRILAWTGDQTVDVAISQENLSRLSALDSVEWTEPFYGKNVPYNVVSAQRVYASELALPPFEIIGDGVKIGVWEAEEAENRFNVFPHTDFENRLTLDDPDALPSFHATHVAGTIGGSGLGEALARGFAPGVLLKSLGIGDGDGSGSMRTEKTEGNVEISNHSYGTVAGWDFTGTGWVNTGREPFGLYDASSVEWDKIVRETGLIIFKAAGNDRVDGPNPFTTDGPYECIPTYGVAKNIITVGATDPEDNLAIFSSCGPTNDGRIKPDVVADGVSLLSTFPNNQYGVLSGTSMASPSACGAGALIYKAFQDINFGNPTPSLLKALIIHGAKDLGRLGPDFEYGWGLVNARKSVRLIERGEWSVGVYDGATTITLPVVVASNADEFKATLVWTDTEAAASAEKTLQNDLNMVIYDEFGTPYLPWMMDTTDPELDAMKGPNNTDNVEQVAISFPNPGDYTIQVTGTLVAGTEQEYSIVCEGLSLNDVVPNVLQVQSDGATSVPIKVSLTDDNGLRDGVTSFTRYYSGEPSVTLEAPQYVPGWRFIGWTGDVQSPQQKIQVALDQNITVVAEYITRPPVIVPATNLRIIEGRTGQFPVYLAGPPPEPVTIHVFKSSGDRDLDIIDGSELYFDETNYNQKRYVTIIARHDDDIENGRATFRLDGGYIAEGTSFVVDEIDDDDSEDLMQRRNDLFANRRKIPTPTGTNTCTNTIIFTRENMEPQIYCNDYKTIRAGGKSAWWEYRAPFSGLMEITTKGSSINTLLGVFSGNDLASLKFITGDDDSGGVDRTSKLTFMAVAGTRYQIVVDGYRGIAGTYVLNWNHASPIQVISPNGGQTLQTGTVQQIRWTTTGNQITGNIKLYLFRAGSYLRTITGSTGNDGSFDWVVPMDLDPGNGYQICALSSDKVYRDLSDRPFEIVDTAPPITVLAPNGGENYITGAPMDISWTSTPAAGSTVKIYLYKGTQYLKTISAETANDGAYQWVVPANMTPGTDYRITVISKDDINLRDYSDSHFSITAGVVIQVTAPNGGERLKKGTTFNIKWMRDLNVTGPKVKIYLNKGNTYHSTITSGTENEGIFAWTIPTTLPDGADYKIVVISSLNTGIRDASNNNFTLIP